MRKSMVILVLLLLAGLFLRVVDIDNIPKAIYGDGLTIVYDSYSLLKTGHDQKGNFLPLFFELGEHRPPGYVYASILPTAIFGPTPLGAYGISILSGLGVIFLLFLLGRMLYSQRVGLIAAFLAGISSWEITLSRGPFEAHLALFLILLGIYAYFKSSQNRRWLILTALTFGFSGLTYPTYSLSAPLILSLLIILDQNRRILIKKQLFITTVAGLIFLTGFGLSLLNFHTGGGNSRVESIYVFNQEALKTQQVQKINEDRKLDFLPASLIPIFHNQFLGYLGVVLENYTDSLSPGFLLIRGDEQPRHNPASTGQIYWGYFFLLVLGVIFLQSKMRRILLFLTGWILIVPVATSLVGPPHGLRNSLMLPPLLLLTAFGTEWLLSIKHKMKIPFLILISLLLLVEFIFFVDKFYFLSPNKYSRFYAYPAKQASLTALEKKNSYDFVILSTRIDNMEFAYPAYGKLDPQKVIAQNRQNTMLGEYKFLNYDNVYIGSIPDGLIKNFLDNLPGSYLYIGPATEREFINLSDALPGPDLMPSLVISEKK